jgi:hypothetical protein
VIYEGGGDGRSHERVAEKFCNRLNDLPADGLTLQFKKVWYTNFKKIIIKNK